MSTNEISQLLGNYGEFVGAIAIVVTLFYLASQIRQANRGIRVASYYQTADHITSTMIPIASSPELSRIWNLGMADIDQLSQEDRDRFNMFMIVYFHQNEAQFFAEQHGFHDDAIWKAKEYELRTWISRPRVNEFWQEYKLTLSADFTSFVDALLEARETEEK